MPCVAKWQEMHSVLTENPCWVPWQLALWQVLAEWSFFLLLVPLGLQAPLPP